MLTGVVADGNASLDMGFVVMPHLCESYNEGEWLPTVSGRGWCYLTSKRFESYLC